MYRIDLNADIGESFGAYKIGDDEGILKYITSANIACGFHAGDPGTMKKTVQWALENGVAIGAHPGFPDLQGFGRRAMHLTPEEVYDIIVYQIGALHAFVQIQGGRLHHVKPHGALYNMAAKDAELADAVAKAVKDIDPELILYGLFGSELIKSACKIGLKTANEAFCDRGYQADGSLVPRSHPGAMIKDAEFAAERLIQMIQTGKVRSVDGRKIDIIADTVCFHGDSPVAIYFAKTLHEKLLEAGVELKAV